MADVTLTYKGQTILEMSASGNKTIKTAGKYCEDDISLAYVKSGGGSEYNILKGSAQPSAGIGQDGDVYLQYAALDGEIENTYVKVNGTWQALTGADVDDVANSGMYTGIEAPPPASLGNDGDYYYQRTNLEHSIQSINESAITGSNSAAYGTQFSVTEAVTVKSVFAMTTENRTGKLQIGTTSQILAETESVTFPANEWVEVPLASPIQLSTNTNYLVKVVIENSDTGRVAYVQNLTNLTYNSKVSFGVTYYGTSWPGTKDYSAYVIVGITFMDSEELFRIHKQFHKASGTWSEIT